MFGVARFTGCAGATFRICGIMAGTEARVNDLFWVTFIYLG